ncbi:MAG TPA: helix-turn-helix domain-containing protein [Candidatus Fimimorpha excrementavium]|nr:helix-turn-helix domain-containing protein [Candidatus Fimimorpha excrementavium]
MIPESYAPNLSFSLDGMTIRILQISRGTIEQVPVHSHGAGTFEIHYLSSGHGTAVIDSHSYPVVPNTLYVTGPLVEHAQMSSPDSPLFEYCINLKAEQSGSAHEASSICSVFLSRPFWFGQDRQAMFPLLQQLFQEWNEKQTGYLSQVRALLTQCIIALVRNYLHSSPMEAKFHPAAKDLPEKKVPGWAGTDQTLLAERYFLYSYDHLSLEELAKLLGLSIRQTQRFLLKHYGKTFCEKKKESRMAAALLLLSSTTQTITSISEKLGFASVEYFSASFKNYYGKTPQEYRKTLLLLGQSHIPDGQR